MKINGSTQFDTPFAKNAFELIGESEFKIILEKNKKNCLFCEPSSPKKILFETDNFYVTFDDSPLIEGHIMIHSKVHYGCCGEVSEELWEELLQLKSQVHDLIIDLYGVCSFYEHGRAGHCSVSTDETLCEHFHLHALPLAEDISSDIAQNHEVFKLNDIKELPSYYEQYDQYLLYENKDALYFYPVVDEIPSHYLRTIVANKINHPERANWEINTNLEFVNNLKKKIESKYE